MDFQIIDGITSADIAFRVEGGTMDELFINASRALVSIMVANPDTIGCSVQKEFTVDEMSPEMLLYEYLNEILFYKDSEQLLLIPDVATISKGDRYTLQCTARGDYIDHRVHRFQVDIKAVTMHSLTVNETPEGWNVTVVVDV